MSGAVKRARFPLISYCFPYKYLRVTFAVIALYMCLLFWYSVYPSQKDSLFLSTIFHSNNS